MQGDQSGSIQKLTKMDFFLFHGFSLNMGGICLISANRGYHQTCRCHIKWLAVTPLPKNLSVGLSASEAEIVSNLGFPVAEHSIWSTTENGQPASFSNSENQLVPPAGEPGTISTESAPLAPYVLEILENRVV